MDEPLVALGRTDIRVHPLGTGTWAWGDRLTWGYGRTYTADDVEDAFHASLTAGVTLFDTAEIYGPHTSERLLGQFIAAHGAGASPLVATKYFPFPWRLGRGSVLRALRGSLRRLGLPQVDLYQIHWPSPLLPPETCADALADVVEAGLTRAVGVSNYSVAQMRRVHARLARRGVPLASNQVRYSLLHRAPESDGVLDACRELGVALIAYSPLAMGLLTGKYTPEHPPTGFRVRRYRGERLARIQPLLAELRTIGEAHDGKTPAEVALNWLICRGALPIPGAKTAQQAQDNAGALGWRLSPEAVARLDEASAPL